MRNCESKSNFLKFSLSPCHRINILALNHYYMINATQGNSGNPHNSCNKQASITIRHTMELTLKSRRQIVGAMSSESFDFKHKDDISAKQTGCDWQNLATFSFTGPINADKICLIFLINRKKVNYAKRHKQKL